MEKFMPKLYTRKQAIELKLETYYTGKPCKRGHIAERIVPDGSCIACRKEAYELNKSAVIAKAVAYNKANKEQRSLTSKTYYRKHKETIQEYRESRKEATSEYNRKYRKANSEKQKDYIKQYAQDNKETILKGLKFIVPNVGQ